MQTHLVSKIMHQNLAVILQHFNYGKNSFNRSLAGRQSERLYKGSNKVSPRTTTTLLITRSTWPLASHNKNRLASIASRIYAALNPAKINLRQKFICVNDTPGRVSNSKLKYKAKYFIIFANSRSRVSGPFTLAFSCTSVFVQKRFHNVLTHEPIASFMRQ